MNLSAKRESLARLHSRYQRAGRPRQVAHPRRVLRHLRVSSQGRPAAVEPSTTQGATQTSRPKRTYVPAEVLPALKAVWLASDQLCSKLLKAALPAWLEHHQRRGAALPEALKKKLRR